MTKGVTLIELLVAVAMIAAVVSALSLFFPKASQALAVNRQRLTASRLAQSAILAAQRSPYDLIDATLIPPPCDCTTVDFSTLASTTTVVNGISYDQRTCVNFVDLNHQPICPDFPNPGDHDNGLKKVRVRLTWSVGGDTHSVDMDTTAARL